MVRPLGALPLVIACRHRKPSLGLGGMERAGHRRGVAVTSFVAPSGTAAPCAASERTMRPDLTPRRVVTDEVSGALARRTAIAATAGSGKPPPAPRGRGVVPAVCDYGITSSRYVMSCENAPPKLPVPPNLMVCRPGFSGASRR